MHPIALMPQLETHHQEQLCRHGLVLIVQLVKVLHQGLGKAHQMHPGMLQHLQNFDLVYLDQHMAQLQQMHLFPGEPHQTLATVGLFLMIFLTVLNFGMQQQTTTIVNIVMQLSIGSVQLIVLNRILIVGGKELCIGVLSVSTLNKVRTS